jgi:hypothetical protein
MAAALWLPVPAAFISGAIDGIGVAIGSRCDCALRSAPLHPTNTFQSAAAPHEIEKPMRPEIERLVEEIEQSVGLLRRHL